MPAASSSIGGDVGPEAMYEVAIKHDKGGEPAKKQGFKGIAGDDSHPVAKVCRG